MAKRIRTALFAGAALVGGASVYINATQGRSLRAWLVERSMWLTGMKTQCQEKAALGIRAYEAAQEADTVPLPNAYIDGEIGEYFVSSMQVLTWNDSGKPDQPVIFYIHGGAYIHHAVSFNYKFIDKIAQVTGAKIVMPIYPLAPKHTCATVMPKMVAAYQFAIEDAGGAHRVTVMGDSAGGGLALGLGLALKDEGLPQPKQYILYSPWADVTMTNDGVVAYDAVDPMLDRDYLRLAGLAWAGSDAETRDPYVSPVLGDLTGLAPVTLFMGTHEILMADIPALKDALIAGKVDYRIIIGEKMNHGYPFFPIPEAQHAIRQTAILITE